MQVLTNIQKRIKGDSWIWLSVVFLSIASVLAVYSASGSLVNGVGSSSTETFLMKQLAILFLGFGLAYFIQSIHYTIFGKLSVLALGFSIILLVYTLFYGMEINDARRWIQIPIINSSFQTSDFARLSLIVYLAYTIAQAGPRASHGQFFMVHIFLPIIVVCGLIMPSDLSTAMMLFTTCFILLIVGGVNWRLLAFTMGMLVILGAIFIGLGTFFDSIRSTTWVNRITTFLGQEGDTFQITQAKIAIAEGGLFGEGPGNSVQRNFLPSPYADFIYAIIIEEYGLIGGVGLMGVYFFLLYRCVKIVTLTTRYFAALLTVGISVALVLQALLNMAVSVDLVPVTGLNLPFVSKGGTSAIFQFIAIGMVLSVSHYSDLQRLKDQEEQLRNEQASDPSAEQPISSPQKSNYENYD
ncbi:MAG: FtsW/RodA/SpoVE family cell cycle protein [Bacteroidetes bacterium]|jgi:cell division protein FtsW|nr:FtsW/RodA/SpoVE family cell cycle protein [Bacteroidota bacterium]